LARRLAEVLGVGGKRVSPADQLSQKRLPFEIDFEGWDLERRIASIEDGHLRALVRIAVENRGLAEHSTPGTQEILGAAGDGDDPGMMRGEWRQALEEGGIGTLGPVSLKDFGIRVEEPALIIFQEWMQHRAEAHLCDVEEPDTVVEAGVDLFIDLDRVATRFETQPPKLTRTGRIPKRTVEALRALVCLPRIEGHLEGDLCEWVIGVAQSLGLVEFFANQVRVHDERLRVWRKIDLLRQMEMILERFLVEKRGGRWSFHQEALRHILLDTLRREKPEDWICFDSLVGLAVSTYLLELEEREVREALRQRREEDFARERLNSSFHRLGTDLTYWIVHRFLPLGACELGMRDGKLTTFRLTALGKDVLGNSALRRKGASKSRILVNPDFEIILFSEDLRGMRLELEMSRFGERISAERVRRYRITRDSMRHGIRSGLSLAEIRKILAAACEHPLPETVLVALKDWGKDLDWLIARPALVVTGLRQVRARELCELLDRERCAHRLCEDGTVVILDETLPSDAGAGSPRILERLREEGWLVREPPRKPLEFRLEEGASRRA
ncbi:MAG: helicase-associated domain-containing protein, partial [Planctomycetota bacterium]